MCPHKCQATRILLATHLSYAVARGAELQPRGSEQA